MFSLCSRGFPPGALVSPTIKTNKNVQVYLQSVPLAEVHLRVAVLWLPTSPQKWAKCRDKILLNALYVTNKVPLPLPDGVLPWFYSSPEWTNQILGLFYFLQVVQSLRALDI